MKILAVKLRAIGDSVIWTSALSALHKAFPDAEIHVLTYGSNSAVFEFLPYVHKTHFLKTKGRVELMARLWSLRKEKFDWFLGFHANTSLCRWAWLAGAKKMALHHHSWTFTPKSSVEIPEPGKLEDAIARDYQILRAMGAEVARQPTKLEISHDEMLWARNMVEAEIRSKGGDLKLPVQMFLPGAAQNLRRYPKDLWWKQVVKARDARAVQPVVLVDESLAREWNLEEECLKMRIPLIPGGSLRAFMSLIAQGQRSLANDSGPGHISVALGLITSFVFGPGCAGDWHCYDRVEHPIYRVAGLSCRLNGPSDRDEFRFCTVNECSHHTCMRDIDPLKIV